MTDIHVAIQEMYQKSMQLQSLAYGDPGRAAARASAPRSRCMPTSLRGARFNTLANEMIDAFIGSGEVDAYDAWCEPLPSTIFLSITGLPMTDRDQFIGFKNRILGTARAADLTPEQVMAERMEAVVSMQQYFDRDLDVRQAELTARDDMIGWLLTTEVDNERLTREEVLDILGLPGRGANSPRLNMPTLAATRAS